MTRSKSSSPFISIIIPVYNVEPYLCTCLDSVVDQTLGDIEIICVNDGSTDRSLVILKEYADKDDRIRVIDKKINEGLSATRNVGMAAASGKYLLFVDSDDYIDNDLCRQVLECGERNHADLVIYDFAAFRNARDLDANRKKVSALAGCDPSDRAALLRIGAFTWTKMIRSDLARSLDLRFPVGLTYEDMPVHWQLVILAPQIALLPQRLCFYRQRSASISYRRDWAVVDKVKIYDLIRDFLRSHHLYGTYRDVFLQSQLNVFCWLDENIHPSHRKRLMDLIRERLAEEHWAYVDSDKELPWKTRDFCRAIRGSYVAKTRRACWLLARDWYRRLKSVSES